MKAGIFLDVENLNRNGGWGLRYDAVKKLVEAQDFTVLRANAYMAVDRRREAEDTEYGRKKQEYRDRIRRCGFRLVLKTVKHYRDEEGRTILKANADLDLAVDALLQSENLDYVLLGTGDGDFIRLVRALQSRGKRVDVLAFSSPSSALRREADYYISGFLFPGLLTEPKGETPRLPGFVHHLVEADSRGEPYAFLSAQRSLKFGDVLVTKLVKQVAF